MGVSGEECSNDCNDKISDWCSTWQSGGGEVLRCADYASNGKRCLSECSSDGEEYTWCKVGSAWDYCSGEGVTTRGERCTGPCMLHDGTTEDYWWWWCNTDSEDSSKWDYCSNHSRVQAVHYSINGQECGQAGEEYWWCYKPQRWQGKYSDPDWDYCSPSHQTTRYNKPCLDECATRGSDNFWCNIAGDTWDYCSPAVPPTPANTVGGTKCAGICDYYKSSNLWCTRFTTSTEDWWDYCGSQQEEIPSNKPKH